MSISYSALEMDKTGGHTVGIYWNEKSHHIMSVSFSTANLYCITLHHNIIKLKSLLISIKTVRLKMDKISWIFCNCSAAKQCRPDVGEKKSPIHRA